MKRLMMVVAVMMVATAGRAQTFSSAALTNVLKTNDLLTLSVKNGAAYSTRTISASNFLESLKLFPNWTGGGGGGGVTTFNGRAGAVVLGSGDIGAALGFTPIDASLAATIIMLNSASNSLYSQFLGGTPGVTTVNGRFGDVALIAADITGALGYTPVDAAKTNTYVNTNDVRSIRLSNTSVKFSDRPNIVSNPAQAFVGLDSSQNFTVTALTPALLGAINTNDVIGIMNTNGVPVVNVKAFGAVGNDSTDDTVAIQAAMDFATTNSSSSGRVYLPTGTYRITDSLFVRPSTKPFEMFGDQVADFTDGAAISRTRIRQVTAAKNAITGWATNAGEVFNHLYLHDLRVVGGTNSFTGSGIMIGQGTHGSGDYGAGRGIKIERVYVAGFANGVRLEDTVTTYLSQLSCQFNTNAGLYLRRADSLLSLNGQYGWSPYTRSGSDNTIGVDAQTGGWATFIGTEMGNCGRGVILNGMDTIWQGGDLENFWRSNTADNGVFLISNLCNTTIIGPRYSATGGTNQPLVHYICSANIASKLSVINPDWDGSTNLVTVEGDCFHDYPNISFQGSTAGFWPILQVKDTIGGAITTEFYESSVPNKYIANTAFGKQTFSSASAPVARFLTGYPFGGVECGSDTNAVTLTANKDKWFNRTAPAYGGTTYNVGLDWYHSDAGGNHLDIGTSYQQNGMNDINLYTASGVGSGSKRWTINSSGHDLPGANLSYDIGSASLQVRSGYFGSGYIGTGYFGLTSSNVLSDSGSFFNGFGVTNGNVTLGGILTVDTLVYGALFGTNIVLTNAAGSTTFTLNGQTGGQTNTGTMQAPTVVVGGTMTAQKTVQTNATFTGTAFANLPTPAGNEFPMIYCTDVLTPYGSGGLVRYDGSTWRTLDGNIAATLDTKLFTLYAASAGVNMITPVMTAWNGAQSATVSGSAGSMFAPRPVNNNNGTFSADVNSTTFEPRYFYSTSTASSGAPNSFFGWDYFGAGTIWAAGGKYSVGNAPTAAENYYTITGVGFTASSTNFPTVGAFFLFDTFTNSHAGIGAGPFSGASATYTNNWIAVTCQGSSYTYVDTKLPVAVSTTTSDRLAVVLTTTNSVFYTNGVVAVSNILTLPTTQSLYPAKVQITKTAGSTARLLYEYNPWVNIRHAAYTY